MNVVYFTDFCCDLPSSYAAERNFHILPMAYKIGDQEIFELDDPRMPIHTFYDKMRAGEMSSTSQVNTYTFIERFRPVLEQGNDIFYISFSSGLSGTYQSSLIAKEQLLKEFPERKLYIVDSLLASMGQGLYMYYALNMRDEGKSPEEIAQWLENNKQNFCSWFTVSDLQFLRRGGRVSAAAAFLGTMLSIKPVLHVDAEGHLIAMEKVKGRARSLKALVDHMEQTVVDPENQMIFISHGDNQKDVDIVADMVRERFHVKDVMTNYIGPLVGAHSGPDTIALFFYGKHRD